MNTIIHFFASTDKLRSFIYDACQEGASHKNLGSFTDGWG